MTTATANLAKPEPPPPLSVGQKWLRRFKWLAGVTCLLVLGLFVSRFVLDLLIDRELAAIRAKGQPASFDEISAYLTKTKSHEPDADAQLFLTAIKQIEILRDGPDFNMEQEKGPRGKFADLPFVGWGDRPDTVDNWPQLSLAEEVLQTLKPQREAFQAIVRRRSLDHANPIFPPSVRKWKANLVSDCFRSDVYDSIYAIHVIELQFTVAAAKKDSATPTRCVLDALRWFQLLKNEQSENLQSLRTNLFSRIQPMIVLGLETNLFDDMQMREIQAALRQLESNGMEQQSAIVQRAIVIDALCRPPLLFKNNDWLPGVSQKLTNLLWRPVLLRYLRFTTPLIESQQLSIDEKVAAYKRPDHSLSALNDFIGNQTDQFLTGWTMPPEVEALLFAKIRATDAAIGVCRYRKKRNANPKSLQELVPDFLASVPKDPFDSSQLAFTCDEDGLIIDSPGVLSSRLGQVSVNGKTLADNLIYVHFYPLP